MISEKEIKKAKVMLHIPMPNQISGPNTSTRIISDSYLEDKYNFVFLVQDKLAGGRLNISLIIDLYKQIRREKPDIIHLAGLQSSGFHAILACKLARNKRVIMTVHGFAGDSLILSKMKKFIFNKIIEPFTLYFSDAVYTVCKYASERKMIKKYARNYIGYIHNSAPIIDMNESKSSLREELNLSKTDIVCTTASRIVEDKGYKYLAQAIKTIDCNKSNLKFVIIGDGAYKNELEKMLADEINEGTVFFLGHRKDVVEILKCSDIFIFPTLHENLSNSLLEACATRNAIIATNVGGNPEVIKDGINGILIPPYDSEAIQNAIIRYIKNPEFRLEMSSAAYETALSDFSQENNLTQIDELYENLLNKEK